MLKKLVYQRFKTHGAAAELVYKLPLQTSAIISGEVINTCLAPPQPQSRRASGNSEVPPA